MMMKVSVILSLIIVGLLHPCFAFQTRAAAPPPNFRTGAARAEATKTKTTSVSSVGNWISGVTNTPPTQPLLTAELQASLVSNTILQDKVLSCVYRATSDGWSAIDFHRAVDEKGSCLVVALTRSGQLIGGFNPAGWRSTDDYYNSNAAFLWYERGGRAVKCPVLKGGT
jgi:TLD